MAKERNEEKTLMEKLQQNYRMVIMNDETFEEKGSYKLTLLNVYILISTAVVLVALFVIASIVFTPIKRFIPGYGDVSKHAELLRMNQKIDQLEEELTNQKVYSDNFRRILIGDFTTTIEEAPEEVEIHDSLLNVPRIEEDEALRKEIELDERIQEQALLNKSINFSPRDIPLELMYFIAPIRGEISANYTLAKKHFGIDLVAPKNTAVKAVLDGYVIASDWTLETGNSIGIQHANNLVSFYKHNSVLLKKVGSYVKSGEAVAIIGNTGTHSDGPHLHFELWHKGKSINPTNYITF